MFFFLILTSNIFVNEKLWEDREIQFHYIIELSLQRKITNEFTLHRKKHIYFSNSSKHVNNSIKTRFSLTDPKTGFFGDFWPPPPPPPQKKKNNKKKNNSLLSPNINYTMKTKFSEISKKCEKIKIVLFWTLRQFCFEMGGGRDKKFPLGLTVIVMIFLRAT